MSDTGALRHRLGAVGAAIACYECARDYAGARLMFGRPIAGYQLVQAKLVEMITEITKAQLLCLRLGRLKHRRRRSGTVDQR